MYRDRKESGGGEGVSNIAVQVSSQGRQGGNRGGKERELVIGSKRRGGALGPPNSPMGCNSPTGVKPLVEAGFEKPNPAFRMGPLAPF